MGESPQSPSSGTKDSHLGLLQAPFSISIILWVGSWDSGNGVSRHSWLIGRAQHRHCRWKGCIGDGVWEAKELLSPFCTSPQLVNPSVFTSLTCL